MKKWMLLISIASIFMVSGCFKKDSLENIEIYTTAYPIEYITTALYGNHSTIKSIYPDSINITSYELNEKQISDYSKADMYIFNGLSNEKNYLASMVEKNNKLMMIDSTQTMEITYNSSELWLNPSNILMMASNIRKGLLEYIQNIYLTTEIDTNYNKLKIDVSNIDASLKLLSENNNNPTIVVDNNAFKFLEKYGFTVISLDKDNKHLEKAIATTEKLIAQHKIDYIFTLNKSDLNHTVKDIQKKYDVKIAEFKNLANLTNKERDQQEDLLTLMNHNIDLLREEIYD